MALSIVMLIMLHKILSLALCFEHGERCLRMKLSQSRHCQRWGNKKLVKSFRKTLFCECFA